MRKPEKCTMDCFHCKLPDCCNGSGTMTEWEQKAIKNALAEDEFEIKQRKSRYGKEYYENNREAILKQIKDKKSGRGELNEIHQH